MAFSSTITVEPVVSLNEVMTPAEAAQFMRTSPRTLRRWVADGRVPCHSIAGRPRYIRAELLAVLDHNVTN
jgi:excisionase family DNA binding protein